MLRKNTATAIQLSIVHSFEKYIYTTGAMNSGMEINNIVVAAVERLIDSVSSLPHLGQNGANLTDGRLIIGSAKADAS